MTDCPRHKHCAYTGTEPGLCATCHASTGKCAGRHGGAPNDGWRSGVARGGSPTLQLGQYNHPGEAHKANWTPTTPRHSTSEKELAA